MKSGLLNSVIDAKRNIVISGDISTGKSIGVVNPIIDSLIDKKESLVVLDAKEEYLGKYFCKLRDNKYNILILNLRDSKKSIGWNPLEYPYSLYENGSMEEAISYIERMYKTICFGNGIGDFWDVSACNYLVGLTLGLFEDANSDEINFNSIYSMLVQGEEKYGTLNNNYIGEYFGSRDKNSAANVSVNSIVSAPMETRNGIISLAQDRIRELIVRDNVSKLLSYTSFNYEDILLLPTACFVVARDEDPVLNMIATMFMEQLFYICLGGNRVNFVMDNLEVIPRINNFSNMLGSGLSRNIKFYLVTRSLDQLRDIYGNYLASLCYNIRVNDKNIEVNTKNGMESIANDMIFDSCTNNCVLYPELDVSDIKVFDLKKYMRDKKQDYLVELNTMVMPEKDDYDNHINEIIKEIDKRIVDLEEEDRINKFNVDGNYRDEMEDIVSRIDKRISEIENDKINDNDYISKLIDEIDRKITELEKRERNRYNGLDYLVVCADKSKGSLVRKKPAMMSELEKFKI